MGWGGGWGHHTEAELLSWVSQAKRSLHRLHQPTPTVCLKTPSTQLQTVSNLLQQHTIHTRCSIARKTVWSPRPPSSTSSLPPPPCSGCTHFKTLFTEIVSSQVYAREAAGARPWVSLCMHTPTFRVPFQQQALTTVPGTGTSDAASPMLKPNRCAVDSPGLNGCFHSPRVLCSDREWTRMGGGGEGETGLHGWWPTTAGKPRLVRPRTRLHDIDGEQSKGSLQTQGTANGLDGA